MKCIVQDGEKYGRSLAVAVLVNELKGIFGKVQTIIAIYNNCKLMLIDMSPHDILVGLALQRPLAYFYKEGRPYLKRMNNKAILLATIAFLAVSSFLMIGGIGIQTADAGSGPGCNHKGGASTTVDPNAPNAVNTNIPVTPQPTV